MKFIITLALAVLLLGTCSARIGGAGSSDGSNMESITVLRDFDEAGIGGKATKAKLSKIKEQLDDSFELKTLRYPRPAPPRAPRPAPRPAPPLA